MYNRKLLIAYPGAEWGITNASDFSTLIWLDSNSIPKPTVDELELRFQIMAPVYAMDLLRQKRNNLLRETDIYGLADYPFASLEERQSWFEYRAKLRDLTKTAKPTLTVSFDLDESSITWPCKP